MVSIMRSEQTLRLIQLYHANYPEIARNNQDADGRTLKLHMWAQITAELNRSYDTAFTVEQFKKKVQNVQCTSRQKLYSGKRNLGEAEVEYLRLFESDKISEEMLVQRAKNRRSLSICSADFLAFRQGMETGGRNGEEEEDEENGEAEEALLGEGSSTTQESESGNECSAAVAAAALTSLNTLLGSTGTVAATCQPPPPPPQQLDAAQQFLLAMLNVTMSGASTGTGTAPAMGREVQLGKRKAHTDGGGGAVKREKTKAREEGDGEDEEESNEAGLEWRAILQMQRETLDRQRQLLRQMEHPSADSERSGAPQCASPSFAAPKGQQHQCQCERICSRLDTMNAALAKIAELIVERLPPVGEANRD